MSREYLRIASYDIRKSCGPDNWHMPERSLEVINGPGADIVVLQGADRRLGLGRAANSRALISAETDFSLIEVSENDVSLCWHGTVILMRSNVNVACGERIILSGPEPRRALRISLDINGGLCIMASHLVLRRLDRRMQLEVLRNASLDRTHAGVAGAFIDCCM